MQCRLHTHTQLMSDLTQVRQRFLKDPSNTENWRMMSQEGPSKQNKRLRSSSYIKDGPVAAIVRRKRSSAVQIIIQTLRSSEEHLSNPIEGQQLEASEHLSVEAHIQTEVCPYVEQPVERQAQMDSTTIAANEQPDEQGPTQKRKRGRTKMYIVHGRHERQLIVLNEFNQPIGPSKAAVKELGSFLGTLARNATLCPLDKFDWRKMDTKDDLWKYTKEKYDIPDAAKTWALEAIHTAWRRYKSQLKKDHYDTYVNDEIRIKKRPAYVPESQFKSLLKYWNSEAVQKMSKINTENRKKWKNPHTSGKTSFAVIRNELEKEKATLEGISLEELFVATRKRKPGRSYKEPDEDTISKIAEMKKIESEQSGEGSQSVNAFASVMGAEHPGRLRLYGRGVTKTSLKGKVGHVEPALNVTDDLLQKMVERMEEKLQKKFEEQKEAMRQKIIADVIAQLQHLIPTFQVDPNMLATISTRSPGEACSATSTQPIHKPPIGTNHHRLGGSNEQMIGESSEDTI